MPLTREWEPDLLGGISRLRPCIPPIEGYCDWILGQIKTWDMDTHGGWAYRRIQMLSYIIQAGLRCNGGMVEGKKSFVVVAYQRQEDIVRV